MGARAVGWAWTSLVWKTLAWPRHACSWPLLAACCFGGQVEADAGVLGTSAPLNPRAPSVAPVTQPRQLFLLHCAGCHGIDGSARDHAPQRSGVPDLHHIGALLAVPGGREFLIRVPGVMGSGLDDAQVAAVANWMLERFVPPEDRAQTAPYTEADARQARKLPMTDVMRTRQQLLDAPRNAGGR